MDKIDKAIELLKGIEWTADKTCPLCSRDKGDGHWIGCRFHKALALLESCKAEQVNWEKCQYCGASRIVRPSGEWQFTCHCDEPERRPKANQPPAGEFTKRIRKAIVCVDKREEVDRRKIPDNTILDACDRLDAQQQEIERLKADRNALVRFNTEYSVIRNELEQQIKNLTAENKAQVERIEKLEAALESISEYWNKSENDRAMNDALYYMIDVAEQALKEKP